MGSSVAKGRELAAKVVPRLLGRGPKSGRAAHLAAPPPANEATLKHVAICGVSYCGSTLMARILGSLPEVANIGESHWLLSRREDGVTVPVDPRADDWADQVPCWSCGRDCRYLTRDFRAGLHADPLHWYHRIAERLGTDVLVSADKNYNKVTGHDPLLRLDALVLFKSPREAVYSHFRYRGLKGHPAATGREVDRYLTTWARAYEAFLDDFEVRGRKVVLSWPGFCGEPAGHLARVCAALGLPFEVGVLERIDTDQHSLGGNGRVNRHFRRDPTVEIRPPVERTLPAEQQRAVDAHGRSRRVHDRLCRMHQRVFDGSET